MAAGLGEASAIFAVADAGLKFSTTLLEYIREAKGAPAQINRIANVIETTSEQLKQVGQLIDNNVRRKVLSDSGVSSAQRCSDECNQILKTLRMTLCKNGWQQNFGDANADIDISLWSAMQWPFIKPKLEAPRAELDRIKLDLTFILTLASVLQASTPEEQARRGEQIPEIERAREWAARRVAKAKMKPAHTQRQRRPRYVPYDDTESDFEDDEILSEFMTYKERRVADQEEQRHRAQAALIAAEEAKKEEEVKQQRQAIVMQAREDFKDEIRRENEEREMRQQKVKDRLRDELLKLKLPPEQVRSIAESVDLSIDENPDAIKLMAYVGQKDGSPSGESLDDEMSVKTEASSLRRNSSVLPWKRSKGPKSKDNLSTSNNSPGSSLMAGLATSGMQLAAWTLDLVTSHAVELGHPQEWLRHYLVGNLQREGMQGVKMLSRRCAQLSPQSWKVLSDFIGRKNGEELGNSQIHWVLLYVDHAPKSSRNHLFSRRRISPSLEIILGRQDRRGPAWVYADSSDKKSAISSNGTNSLQGGPPARKATPVPVEANSGDGFAVNQGQPWPADDDISLSNDRKTSENTMENKDSRGTTSLHPAKSSMKQQSPLNHGTKVELPKVSFEEPNLSRDDRVMDEDRSTNYPGDYRDPSFDPPNLSGDYGSRNWPPPSPYAVSYPAASSYYNDWNHYPPQPTYRWSAEPNSAGNLRYPYDRGHGPRSRSTDSSMPHINIYRDSSEDAWLSRYRHGYEETPFRSSRDRNRPGSHYEEGLDELPRRSRSRNHVDTYNIPPPAHSRTRSPSPPVAMHNRYYNAGLNPEANAWGSGLHRSYSHGYAPAPQVNIYQDIAQDALQRTDPSIPEWSSSDDNYGEMTRNAKREESQSSDRRKKRMKPRSYPGTDERESIVIRPTHSRASRSPSSMGYYQTPYRPYRSPQVRGQSRDPDNEYYRSPYGRSPARRNSRSRSADNLEKYPSRGARPGSYRESEWALVPYTRNNPVTLSPVSEASAGGFEERTESESDIRKASGLEHVAQLTPNDNETILKALQEYTTFKNRATEASSTSVKEDLVSKERPGKRGKTKAPKRLMNKDILREYGSVSEEGDHYILDKALEKEQIDEIIRRSKEVQRTIGSPEITYSFGEATSTSGRQGSSYKESGGSNARTEANDNGSIIEQAKDPGIDAEYALGRIVVDNSDSASVGPDDSVSRVNRLRSRSRDDSESNAEVAEQTRPKYLVEKPEWTPLAKEWTSQGSLRKKKKGRKKQAKFVDGPPLDDQSEPDVVVKETISEPDRRQTKRRVKGRKAEVDEDSTRLSPPLGEDHDTAADAEGQESRSLSRQDENERRGRHDEQDKEFFAPVPPPPPPPDWFEEQRSNLHRIASPSGQSRSRAATVEDFDE